MARIIAQVAHVPSQQVVFGVVLAYLKSQIPLLIQGGGIKLALCVLQAATNSPP